MQDMRDKTSLLSGDMGKQTNQEDGCYTKAAPQEYWDVLGENEPKDPDKLLSIDRRNEIFNDGYLSCERGWAIMPDGTGTCAGYMAFPCATPEMIYWWFACVSAEPLHDGIMESKRRITQIMTRGENTASADRSVPLRQQTWGRFFLFTGPDTQEDAGEGEAVIRVSFHSPAEFGLDEERMGELGEDIAVICCCASVSGQLPITSFIHVCRKTDFGIELRSRFWYGWGFENGKPVRAHVEIPESSMRNIAQSQSVYLIEKYYQLSQILPELYDKYKDTPQRALDFL